MALKLDLMDKKILQELEKDSSQALHLLARKIQRSKQFVSYRIKRMEDAGLITGYTAMIDVFSLGYSVFRITLDLQHMTEVQKKAFAEEMKRQKEIRGIILIHAHWDIALFVLTKHIHELRDLWDHILEKYRKQIRNHRVYVYAPIYHYEKSFLAKNTREEKVLGFGEQKTVKGDTALLFRYAAHVREPLLTLAKHMKRAPITIKKQVLQYKKENIILGQSLGINPAVIGLHSYLVELTLEGVNRRAFMHACKKIPEIYEIHRIIGGADEEIVCMVESKQHLLQILDRLKEQFPELKDDKYMEFSPFFSKGIIPF